MKLLIGIDLQDLKKFRRAVNRSGDRFLKRIFTEREISYCYRFKDPIPHLAARFSAKEAFAKALKPVLEGRVFEWREIEVVSRDGKPVFNFSKRVMDALEKLGISDVELSLSHSGDHAVAVVLVSKC